ncbi:MAG: MFS transporter [Oscillospiraceae bacterium]
MSFKLTKLEKYWIMYDVGNSAFTLLIATIMPIYFNYLAAGGGLDEVDYLAYWGYAASITTLIVMISGPVFGSLADTKDLKKPVFFASILIGVIGCLALGFIRNWLAFLIVFIIAKAGYSVSLVFYDSMLGDVTSEERVDTVSSLGYAWGYIGSCIPFVLCLLLVLFADKLGISMNTAMMLAFAVVSVWWIGVSVPLLKNYKQKYFIERRKDVVKESFSRLWGTLKSLLKEKNILMFLAAFFFYIDGVYTIIDMATAYGTALGLDTTGLLLALLVTQVVAFPCSIIFGKLSRKFDPDKLITVCIIAYLGIAVFAMIMSTQLHFWILAVAVGMFQGGIQALSRSYFVRIIPKEKSGEYFGIMDICGKGAAFVGTGVVSLVSQLTGDISKGVGMIAVLFVIGALLFRRAVALNKAGVNKQ